MTLTLIATGVLHDAGSIVILTARMDGKEYAVNCERRPAERIIEAMRRGEEPEIDAPDWAVRPLGVRG